MMDTIAMAMLMPTEAATPNLRVQPLPGVATTVLVTVAVSVELLSETFGVRIEQVEPSGPGPQVFCTPFSEVMSTSPLSKKIPGKGPLSFFN